MPGIANGRCGSRSACPSSGPHSSLPTPPGITGDGPELAAYAQSHRQVARSPAGTTAAGTSWLGSLSAGLGKPSLATGRYRSCRPGAVSHGDRSFRLRHPPEDLVGFEGAAEYDFFQLRQYRQRNDAATAAPAEACRGLCVNRSLRLPRHGRTFVSSSTSSTNSSRRSVCLKMPLHQQRWRRFRRLPRSRRRHHRPANLRRAGPPRQAAGLLDPRQPPAGRRRPGIAGRRPRELHAHENRGGDSIVSPSLRREGLPVRARRRWQALVFSHVEDSHDTHNKVAMRAAVLIHEQLAQGKRDNVPLRLPEYSWSHDPAAPSAKSTVAMRRGWHEAARRLSEEMADPRSANSKQTLETARHTIESRRHALSRSLPFGNLPGHPGPPGGIRRSRDQLGRARICGDHRFHRAGRH